jgi:uncharacterized protein involved in exopolysaccharide biosynthesis
MKNEELDKEDHITEDRIVFEDEFDLLLFAKEVIQKRKFVIRSIILSIAMAIVFLLIVDNEYEVDSMLLSLQPKEGVSSKFAGLAGLAGINLASDPSSGLSSTLYPDIVASIPFRMSLLDQSLDFQDLDTSYTVRDYFAKVRYPSWSDQIKEYTIKLPKKLLQFISGPKPVQEELIIDKEVYMLSLDDKLAISELKDRIIVEVDDDLGTIIITTEMPDRMACAQLNVLTAELLKSYITEYQTNKAKLDLEYLQKSYEEAKINYDKAQEELAVFTDQHQNVILTRARIEQKKLENSYNIAFNIFNGISSQLEQAKINLNKEIPVFSQIQPAVLPSASSYPKTMIVLFLSVFLGVFFSVGFIFLKMFLLVLVNLYKKA